MKNILFFALISVTLFGCTVLSNISINSDVPAPAFDKPNSVVLDIYSGDNYRYEDYIRIYSAFQREDISFNVYGYDAVNKTWTLIGPARLKKFGDRDTVDSPLRGKLNKFRWLAVQSLDNLDFQVQFVVRSNDILITVFEKD